jgi:DDE superfamily endonuclease
MWCIGTLTEEYRSRMYDVLELYARPYCAQEPVICIDEKSKQLIRDSRRGLPMRPGAPAKYDYEYVRGGTCNVFVAVEPKGGCRVLKVTERRTTPEFVGFVRQLLERTYASARKVHLVLDNLNTHFRSCFDEVLGRSAARALLRRVQFHYTPKHASWLNMAEIEISILERQCLGRRLIDRATARREVNAWERRRNAERRGIDWTFTRQDADRKLGHHYVS